MQASAIIAFDLVITLTLKIFSAMPTHMMNIYDKFHWNPSTEYRDIAFYAK